MTADPFSEILSFTNATSLVTGGFSAGGEWAIRFPAPDKIKFFAVVKGYCWVKIEGEDQWIRFDTGDVGLLAAPRSFILASKPDVSPVEAMEIFSGAGRSQAQLGDGADFAHLGGHVLLDPMSGKLLSDVLPAWIHIPASSPHAINFQWLLNQLVIERRADMPGSELASAQLAQLLFIQILRAHLMSTDHMPVGWLKAMRDPGIAPAFRLMHAEPAHSWHLDALAKECAMSRTTFAVRFKSVTGDAPLTYLTKWRMTLAERMLRTGTRSVATVAQLSGYSSESAFSNAFKRITGKSPKVYRKTTAYTPGATQESTE